MKLLPYTLCFVLFYFYASALQPTIIDDAFIQFAYADNLAKHGTWGFFPDQNANTATSPLNVLLLTFFTFLTGSTVTGAVWFTALLLLFLLVTTQALSRRLFGNDPFFGLLVFTGIAANPLLLSCIGMEVPLFVLFWIAALVLCDLKRWRLMAACLALLTLARPDGFLLFLIMLPFVMTESSTSRKEKLFFVFLYPLLLLPWNLYSWIQLGSVLPDTLFIKMRQESWLKDVSFGSGLVKLYFQRFPFELLLSFAALPFSFFAIKRQTKPVVWIAGAYGILHYACYSALKVPPYHWYYAHLVLSVVVVGSFGAALLCASIHRWKYILILFSLSGLVFVLAKNGFPLQEAPVHTNWATHDQYKQAGEWLRQNTDPKDTFIMAGEIGTLAYYSKRRLLNPFSDPWTLQRSLNRSMKEDSAFKKALFHLNFFRRKEPQRYRGSRYIVQHVLHPHALRTDPEIVHSWQTSTKWIPQGTLYLRRTRQP